MLTTHQQTAKQIEKSGTAKAPFFKPSMGMVQRKCKACEEDGKMLHRKEGDNAATKGNSGLDGYVNSLGSSGQPLPAASRQFFEPRFGHNFSNVRIHTDSVAAKSAQSINALAYTTGNNIVFNQGQYAPGSESGQKLMAHELTHVVQQGNQNISVQKAGADASTTPAPATKQDKVDSANSQRLANLDIALTKLALVANAAKKPGYDKKDLQKDFEPTIEALYRWARIQPLDAAFNTFLTEIMVELFNNRNVTTKPTYQSTTGPEDKNKKISCPGNYGYMAGGSAPPDPIFVCDNAINSGALCTTDVITHECFHLLGLVDYAAGAKSRPTTPSDSINKADMMAQLVSELSGHTTDNCH